MSIIIIETRPSGFSEIVQEFALREAEWQKMVDACKTRAIVCCKIHGS